MGCTRHRPAGPIVRSQCHPRRSSCRLPTRPPAYSCRVLVRQGLVAKNQLADRMRRRRRGKARPPRSASRCPSRQRSYPTDPQVRAGGQAGARHQSPGHRQLLMALAHRRSPRRRAHSQSIQLQRTKVPLAGRRRWLATCLTRGRTRHRRGAPRGHRQGRPRRASPRQSRPRRAGIEDSADPSVSGSTCRLSGRTPHRQPWVPRRDPMLRPIPASASPSTPPSGRTGH